MRPHLLPGVRVTVVGVPDVEAMSYHGHGLQFASNALQSDTQGCGHQLTDDQRRSEAPKTVRVDLPEASTAGAVRALRYCEEAWLYAFEGAQEAVSCRLLRGGRSNHDEWSMVHTTPSAPLRACGLL